MSSLIRRLEKRIMKKAGYTREDWIVVNGKPVDVRRDGEITDPDDNPIGRDWPARIPARAKMPTKPAKRAFNGAYRNGRKERGQRRGKHSAQWLKARVASADTRPEGGDAKQAPFTSGAVPSETSADAQPLPPLSDSSTQSRESE